MFRRALILTGMALVAAPPASAAGTDEGEAFFESKIRPVLVQHCYECHAGKKKKKGGLRLDSREATRAGGDGGPAVIPGKPDESPLIKAVRFEDLEMPPKGKLPAEVIADLERWVRMGAPDPRAGGKVVAEKKGIDLEAGRKFWAFRPVQPQAVPAVRDAGWPVRDSDRFVLAGLESSGLAPAPDAEPAVLLRRMTYDLTGLPPTDAEIAAFSAAWAAEPQRAIEAAADRLLATRQFAEKWGRHWLDVARYGDSNGSSYNTPYHDAWRYRNWVIASFEQDRPFDDFVVRQIAGDLLPAADQDERDGNLIATGYLMLGSKVLGLFDKDTLYLDVVDEQIDTLGKGLMGLTLGCARCHDHKFDPVPTRDYYALAGILTSTVTLHDRLGGPKEDESDWSRRGLGAGGDARLQEFLKAHRYEWVKTINKASQGRRRVAEAAEALAKARAEHARHAGRLAELQRDLPETALAVRDADAPADTAIRIRGAASAKGAVVPRGFLQVAAFPGQPEVDRARSGRLELARWLTSPQHPLTARVWVNRVWKHLFREGLVRSVDNFGVRGDRPTHPELLDWLAGRFVAGGWKTKPLIRELITSRAYRMGTAHHPASARVDPENKRLWRQNRRRLEPEEIRDSLLLLAGRLDLSPAQGMLGGLPLVDVSNDPRVPLLGDDRRTVYQPVIRTVEADVLQIFDFADTAVVTGARPATTVAPQALYFLNSPLVHESSKAAAKRLTHDLPSRDPAALVREAFRRVVRRPPTTGEASLLERYLLTQFEGPPGPSDHDVSKLVNALLGSTQFQFLD